MAGKVAKFKDKLEYQRRFVDVFLFELDYCRFIRSNETFDLNSECKIKMKVLIWFVCTINYRNHQMNSFNRFVVFYDICCEVLPPFAKCFMRYNGYNF